MTNVKTKNPMEAQFEWLVHWLDGKDGKTGGVVDWHDKHVVANMEKYKELVIKAREHGMELQAKYAHDNLKTAEGKQHRQEVVNAGLHFKVMQDVERTVSAFAMEHNAKLLHFKSDAEIEKAFAKLSSDSTGQRAVAAIQSCMTADTADEVLTQQVQAAKTDSLKKARS